MNHLFRLFWMLMTSRFRPALDPDHPVCVTAMRVWFTDIDVLMHMNNGKYLSLMDLGRVDYMLRMGAFHRLRRQGVYPVLASEAIRFRRSLKLFQKFSLVTELTGWDEKYTYLTQRFVVRGETYATALVKARFLHRGGDKISPEELWRLAGVAPKGEPKVRAMERLRALEEDLRV